MDFRMLGAFEVVAADGRTVDVGGPKQRAVLAMLCLEVGRVVPLDRMINDLWDEPPASAAATIQTYVSNLRRALEPDRPPRTPSTL
ncbi:MAG TPA: winged helix-turn-helix domain-containing protein, partial [Ilumatobacter sp.]|nr:winged helix-turn-helix domain-containing protein [Ilumatobacter sp.]